MEHVNINLNSVKKGTVFKGIGSSLAWLGYIGKSDDKESVDFLCNLLFDKTNPNGLHLNYIRYNVGATESEELAKNFRIGGAVEAYIGNNWTDIDRGQRYFLNQAKKHGVENFEAFSNSSPWYMTKSGSTAGSKPWVIFKPFIKQDITFSNNLRNDKVDEFAKYLVNVTKYLEKNDGITFSSISPINEALNPGWVEGNSQEGCYYNLFGIRGKLFKSLRKELDKQGLSHIDVAGCEENTVFFGFLSLVLNPLMWKSVQRFNVHSYTWGDTLKIGGFENSNIFRRLIRWIIGDKPIVMSEVDFGYTNGVTKYDDFQNVMILADKIMNDIIHLQPQAWCIWQVVEHLTGNAWGALQVDFNNPSNIVYGAKYKAMQHFSHFIKPGDKLLELPKLKNKNLKWIGSQNEKEISLVILSKETTDLTLQFNQSFSNTNISISNSKNFVCDNNLVKTKILENINSLIIPSGSLVSVSFTI